MMKSCYAVGQKLTLGLFLSLLTNSAFAAEKQCSAHYIQLLATSVSAKANAIENIFNQAGFSTKITSFTSDGRKLYRARTGPYSTKQVALKTQQEMKTLMRENMTAQDSIIALGTTQCSNIAPLPRPAKAIPKQLQSGKPHQQPPSIDEKTKLRFAQFKAPAAYTGENHPLVMDEYSRSFRTRLGNAVKNNKPSFAGHYLVTGWGCGSSGCNAGAVINAKTGVVTPFPVSIASVSPLKTEFKHEDGQEHIYQVDSRLMIFAGNLGSDHSKGNDMVEFYEFKDGKFVFLEARPYGRKLCE